ncbi:MAG TPA: hypothetical protein PJ986_20365 [Gammaproteobacteria bacterium]|nr:hypothetical protein [Gammaproteobacteria bacterium]
MKQQINLYQPKLREPAPLFGARAMLRTVAAVLAGLGLVYAWAVVQVGLLEREARQLVLARDAAEQRFTELRTHLPKRVPDPALAARAAEQNEDLQQTRRLMAALSEGSFGNNFGLSPYLVGFARQHVAGTWLTRVEIAAGGTQIGIEGQAQAPEFVPLYVQRLAAEPVFEGKVFSQLKLDRAPDGAAVAFALATSGVEVGIAQAAPGQAAHEN